MVDRERLVAAEDPAGGETASQSLSFGPRLGVLPSAAQATSTAVSALSIVLRHAAVEKNSPLGEDLWRWGASDLIVQGIHWLTSRQNKDGGWSEAEPGPSDLTTTQLVRAALHLTAIPARYAEGLAAAADYVRRAGGIAELKRRSNADKASVACVLMNCALAGMIRWAEVPVVPFELVCLPPSYRQYLRPQYAESNFAALIAAGQCRFFHRAPYNPVMRWLRRAYIPKSLRTLEQLQPASGGFDESIPLTSFVLMSLASMDRIEHPVTRRAMEFLLSTVRADGSWPLETAVAASESNAVAGHVKNA